MTVPTTTAFSGPYFANGATVAFPFGFKVNYTDEVAAFYLEDDGSETVIPSADYTVALSTNENNPGGTITFTVPPAVDARPIYIALDPDFTQGTKFEDEGAFNQSILNPTFDAGALRSIWLRARVARALIAPLGEDGLVFPRAADRANKVLGFDAAGAPVLFAGPAVDGGFIEDLWNLGAGLVGFSHANAYLPGSVGDHLKRFITVTDKPYLAKGDAGGAQGAITGTNNDAAFAAAIADIKAAGGGTLWVPEGFYRLNNPIVVDFDGLTIAGAGGFASQLWINHDGIAIDYTAGTNNLPYGKFHIRGLGLYNRRGYPLDAFGFPQATHQGTALKLTNCYGSTFIDMIVEGFDKSHILHDSAIISFIGFTDRNCWTGRQFTGYTNTIQYFGGVINNSSIDSNHDEVKSIDFFGVDFEAASRTALIGTGNHFYACRIERLHISRAWFKWFHIYGDDNLFDRATKFFWDGSALPGVGLQDFFIEIAGKNNELHFTYVYNHENIVKLLATSANNDIFWSARFLDYEHSGNNAGYRFSRRFYFDAGVGNKLHYKSDRARVEATGPDVLRCEGKLNTYLRNNVLGNMTITAASLTVAALDVAGPLGIPAGSEHGRKVTLAAGATKRATVDPAIVADGNTVYSLVAYVRLPSGGTQVTRVRLGIGDGNFTDVYPADGTDIWHRVVVFHKPANGAAVKFMVEAEGDIGDVFQIAIASLSAGECPAFIDRTHNAVTNTQTTATSFDSDGLRYPGREEAGSFVPGVSLGGTPQAGLVTNCNYSRIGNMVDVAGFVAFTGAPAGAGGMTITGLPYAVSAGPDSGDWPITIVPVNMTYVGMMTGKTVGGSTAIELYQTTEAGARSALTNANFANNSYFYFHARYRV